MPSGVAVIRMSGAATKFAFDTIAGRVPEPRQIALRPIKRPGTGEIIDRGLVTWFPAPHSYTGEDCGELQLHGSPAVIRAIFEILSQLEGVRMAEPGEFSRRAFGNGKLDLTEIEGLADLIGAETEAQRRQAFNQFDGNLRRRAELWREEIIRIRAAMEAILDFADEEDVPEELSPEWWVRARAVEEQIAEYLRMANRGELVRRGFQIVLMGRPNSGKSSLLNAMARRDVAIVTDEAGTTRDTLEVSLDLDGYPVTIVDTAGIREAESKVEQEGVRRARARSEAADLVLWLSPADEATDTPDINTPRPVIMLRSKDDDGRFGDDGVSVFREEGLVELEKRLGRLAAKAMGGAEDGLVTRERQREHLGAAMTNIEMARGKNITDLAIRADYLRSAGDAIGRLTGAIGVEDLLDVIFREFCIGK